MGVSGESVGAEGGVVGESGESVGAEGGVVGVSGESVGAEGGRASCEGGKALREPVGSAASLRVHSRVPGLNGEVNRERLHTASDSETASVRPSESVRSTLGEFLAFACEESSDSDEDDWGLPVHEPMPRETLAALHKVLHG